MTESTRPKISELRRRLYRLGLFVIGTIVLIGLGWSARSELVGVMRSLTLSYFVAASLLGVCFMLLQGVLFARLLGKYSDAVQTRQVIAAFLASQPGKYIPGKVWSAAMQLMALERRHSLGAVAIANLELAAIGAIHMSTLGVACLLQQQPIAAGIVAYVGALAGFAVIILPTATVLSRLAPTLARRLKIAPPAAEVHPMGRRSAFLLSTLLVTVNFSASLLVVHAAGAAIPPGQHVSILAVFYLGFAAAFLAFPVPAGVGVREAAIVGLGLLLVPQVSSPLMLLIALLARLWQLLTDVLCVAVGAILISRRPANSY